MQKTSVEDRRIFARLPATVPLGHFNTNTKRKGAGTTCDLSANGIGLFTGNKLQIYTMLDIWLDVPGQSEPLCTRGEVVWIARVKFNKYRAGVRLEKPELMAISRVLDAVKTKQNTHPKKSRFLPKGLISKCLIFLRVHPVLTYR